MLSLIENASQSGGRATGSKLLEVPNFAPLVRMLPASLHSNSRTHLPSPKTGGGARHRPLGPRGSPRPDHCRRRERRGLDFRAISADWRFWLWQNRGACVRSRYTGAQPLTGALPALLTDRLTVMYKLGSVNTGDCCLWHKQPVNSLLTAISAIYSAVEIAVNAINLPVLVEAHDRHGYASSSRLVDMCNCCGW